MNQYEMKQRAYQSNLKSRALQVLLYLIDRSNKEQTCFPAVPTIGKELHISISTVKRAMKELVDAGYVTKESRYPRICIIVVGILFVSIIFFAISKFSLLFLIACTNVLVVISKFLEKRQEE